MGFKREASGNARMCGQCFFFFPKSGGELTSTIFVQADYMGLKICCGCGWLRIGTEFIGQFTTSNFGILACFLLMPQSCGTKLIK